MHNSGGWGHISVVYFPRVGSKGSALVRIHVIKEKSRGKKHEALTKNKDQDTSKNRLLSCTDTFIAINWPRMLLGMRKREDDGKLTL